MAQTFENVKKKLGFGCMRLPMKDGAVDYAEFSKMVDAFLERYFWFLLCSWLNFD